MLRFRTKFILGISNLFLGAYSLAFAFMMQYFLNVILGLAISLLGAGILFGRLFKKLFNFFVIPLFFILVITLLMLGFDGSVPSHFQTPLWGSVVIILPYCIVLLCDYFVLKHNK